MLPVEISSWNCCEVTWREVLKFWIKSGMFISNDRVNMLSQLSVYDWNSVAVLFLLALSLNLYFLSFSLCHFSSYKDWSIRSPTLPYMLHCFCLISSITGLLNFPLIYLQVRFPPWNSFMNLTYKSASTSLFTLFHCLFARAKQNQIIKHITSYILK